MEKSELHAAMSQKKGLTPIEIRIDMVGVVGVSAHSYQVVKN